MYIIYSIVEKFGVTFLKIRCIYNFIQQGYNKSIKNDAENSALPGQD